MKYIRVAVGAAVETGVCGTVIIPGVEPTFGVGAVETGVCGTVIIPGVVPTFGVEAVETGVCVVVKTPGVVAVNKEINLSGNCTHIYFK